MSDKQKKIKKFSKRIGEIVGQMYVELEPQDCFIEMMKTSSSLAAFAMGKFGSPDVIESWLATWRELTIETIRLAKEKASNE